MRLRTVSAAPDPDRPSRPVTLPASWEDGAAAALSELLPPGRGPAALPEAAELWLLPLGRAARAAGLCPDLDDRLRLLLLRRRAAPDARLWRGEGAGQGPARLVLALGAFHAPGEGLDVPALAQAAEDLGTALRLLPGAVLCPAGLDDLLATLGLPYASAEARDVAACVMALLRGRLLVSARRPAAAPSPDLLAGAASPVAPAGPPAVEWPEPPRCVLPALTEAARAARREALAPADATAPADPPSSPGSAPLPPAPPLLPLPPGPAEALLGVESGGIAPAFAPVTAAGGLTRATQDRLAATGRSPEAALAALLSGEPVLRPAGAADHAAMVAAVLPFLGPAAPGVPLPDAAALAPAVPHPGPAAAPHVPLPERHSGMARRVALAGHRVFLRTAEYADGTPGEVCLTLPREGAAARGLADAFAHAMSLGLQHGVPLEAFVEAFAFTAFGPAGAVEGDPAVTRATSIPDYVVRALAAQYLGRTLPEPEAGAPDTVPPLLRLVG